MGKLEKFCIKRGCVIKSVLYSFKARITRIFFREMIIALLILALQIRVIRVIRALSISKEAYDTPSCRVKYNILPSR